MRKNTFILSSSLACFSLLHLLFAQTPGISSFINGSVDTREAVAQTNDTASWTPSVPLGYPAQAQSDASGIAQSGQENSNFKKNLDSKKPIISFAASTKTLTLIMPRSENVFVSAHVLNGQTISKFSTRKFLTAGVHAIKLANAALANGVIIFRIEGDGFSLVKKISLIDQR